MFLVVFSNFVWTSGVLITSLIRQSQVFVGFEVVENLNIVEDSLIINVLDYFFSAEAICAISKCVWIRPNLLWTLSWDGYNGSVMAIDKHDLQHTSFDWKSFVMAKNASVASVFPMCSPWQHKSFYSLQCTALRII